MGGPETPGFITPHPGISTFVRSAFAPLLPEKMAAAPSGPYTSAGPGLPPHNVAAVAHYRVAMGLGLDGYQQALGESYQQSTHPHPVPVQGALLHAVPPPQPPQPQPQIAVTPAPGQGQFGILAPARIPILGPQAPHVFPQHQQQQQQQVADRANGGLSGRVVANPPDLQEWREKLFNVDEVIVLTNEQ